VQLRFENYGTLFDDPGWTQIWHELLGENFIGFPAGSMAEVIPMHGKSPIVIMTGLALKSLQTQGLYTNPVVDKSATMILSRRKMVYSVSASERPLSVPAQGILAGTAQIIQPFIPDPKEFAELTLRYKIALAEAFNYGIWKDLSIADRMARLGVRKKPQFMDPIARSTTKTVHVLEVTAFNDGDANHIIAGLKENSRITVQCTDQRVKILQEIRSTR
jgi:hypothetical protein